MSVQIVRTFAACHRALAIKLAELDARVGDHDEKLAAIVAAIRQLIAPDGPRNRPKIGFHQGNR